VSDAITGTVLEVGSGQPIRHARVTASIWIGNDFQHRDVLAVLTGDDGRFSFTGLPQGRWEIFAQKSGYVSAAPSTVDIRPNSSWVPFNLTLTPLGAITVTVVDNHGYPLSGAVIRVHSASAKGYQGWSDLLSGEDGKARFSLLGGSYRIEAHAPGLNPLLRVKALTLAPVYYPGTADINRAEVIDVAPGKDTQIDLPVTPIPGRDISGRLDLDGMLISVYLSSAVKDDSQLVWGSTQFDAVSRDFRISGLPPGDYFLNLSVCFNIPCEHAIPFRRAVEIGNADVTGLLITSADRLPGW